MRGWRQVFNQDVPAVPLSWLGHVLPVFEDGDLERPRRQLDDDMRRWVIVRLACRRRVERPETGLDQSCCLRYTVDVLSSLGCCEQWLEDGVIDTARRPALLSSFSPMVTGKLRSRRVSERSCCCCWLEASFCSCMSASSLLSRSVWQSTSNLTAFTSSFTSLMEEQKSSTVAWRFANWCRMRSSLASEDMV